MKLRMVELYVGYNDKTWDTMTIGIPDSMPDILAGNTAVNEAKNLFNSSPSTYPDISFVGVYNNNL